MSDTDLLALNAFQEANLEPDDGMAAVCQVVLHRIALKYQSDGTMTGTVEWPNAFSWTSWEMVNNKYTKVAHTPQEVTARVNDLLARSKMYSQPWARAQRISAAVFAGTYEPTQYPEAWAAIRAQPRTLLYVNPAISHPVWAIPANEVTAIKHHTFYRD